MFLKIDYSCTVTPTITCAFSFWRIPAAAAGYIMKFWRASRSAARRPRGVTQRPVARDVGTRASGRGPVEARPRATATPGGRSPAGRPGSTSVAAPEGHQLSILLASTAGHLCCTAARAGPNARARRRPHLIALIIVTAVVPGICCCVYRCPSARATAMMAVMLMIIIVTTAAAAAATTTTAAAAATAAHAPVLPPTSNKSSNLPGKQCSAVYLPSSAPGVIGAGNIAHKMGATLGECCSACQAEHACVAFDWRHVDRDPEDQINCWLKDNLQRTPEKPGLRISAVLCRAAEPNCSLPVGPPPPPPPPPSIVNNISLSSANLGLRFDGIGGLAAIGGARLLYEYPVAVRSHILDLLFSPTGGGALYHILKIEIEGDSDSSYGSGSSFQHTASPDSMSFARGIYLPWLIQEAKRRQPEIKLYCLSWGLPHWVGRTNGSTSGVLSSQGVAYHRDYLLGAKRVHNISFD
jgi:hypothetical protein